MKTFYTSWYQKKTLTKGTYTSKTADQNAIWATGDITAKLSNVTVKKTGNSDGGDSTSFYGTNSGILASDGANLLLNNIKVTTNSRQDFQNYIDRRFLCNKFHRCRQHLFKH